MSYSDSNFKAYCLQTLEEDIALYGRPVEVISILSQEDNVSQPSESQAEGSKRVDFSPSEAQVLAYWNSFNETDTGFSLVFNNCSDFAFNVLRAAFSTVSSIIVNEYTPTFGIRTPGFILTMAKDLQRRVDEAVNISNLEIKPVSSTDSEARQQKRRATAYFSGPNEFYFHTTSNITRKEKTKRGSDNEMSSNGVNQSTQHAVLQG